MKTIRKYILLFVLALGLTSCARDYKPSAYGGNDGIAPGKIENIGVRNIHGGAVLKYTTPDDPDLLYTKAVLMNSRGERQEVRATMYTDSLVIEGLGNTQEREVKLYAVDRAENESEPAVVTIKPLTPPVIQVLGSLEETETFGGFFLDFENVERAPLSFYINKWNDETHEYVVHDVLRSQQKQGRFIIKGLDHKLTKLALFVRDNWGNDSDTLFTELTPWKETVLDKTKFKLVNVMDDVDWNQQTGQAVHLWDDIIGGYNFGHTEYPLAFPHAFTIDMGVEVRLSQLTFWQRQDNDDLLYAHGAPKVISLWGCEDGKDLENPDNWVLLFDGEMERPSGGKFGDPLTQEDFDEARRGHILSLEQDVPYIRYFRFQSLASWSGMACTVVSEITLWGDIQKEY